MEDDSTTKITQTMNAGVGAETPKPRKRKGPPEEEPQFTIRARDVCSTTALAAWINRARAHGAPKAKIDDAYRLLADFEAWQAANKDQVKVPD